ncbi:hypothetical protein ACFXQA_10330 [Microbacterium sp. P07]|uniref:hypothetical protein n=1 Tax=Microbacterium sp. P07 TaxID=3366952 RepID=UPI0037461B5D
MSGNTTDGLAEVADRFAGVRHSIDEMRSAWPTGAEFEGSDTTGALTARITSSGDVTSVKLTPRWKDLIEPRELVRALNEATGQASERLASKWFEQVVPEELDAHARPTARPRVSLSEYRARNPVPTSWDDLAPKFALAAAARAEYRVYKEGLQDLARRERFESPAGIFRVVRSRATLVALESEKDGLTFRSDGDIEREIVAVLQEIRRRDADDEERLKAQFPALAALRERDSDPRRTN